MKFRLWLAALFGALASLLPGCNAINPQEIHPGVTTAAEVRARFGNPGQEFANADGSVTWEYSGQPNAPTCHMITIGPDHIVQKVEQVITEANLAKVGQGMSPQQVRRLLGAPGSKQVFDNLGEEIWEWRIAGITPMDVTYFDVHFDLAGGSVKRTSQRVDHR